MTQERAAQSGAAASSAALAQAVRGITLLLCATLNDRDTPPSSAAAQSARREPQTASSSAEALSALEALAVGQAAESAQPAPAEEVVARAAGTLGKYGVTRDTAWVDSTLQRLAPLLERVLPPLCSHPQPAVREALAQGESAACMAEMASFTREKKPVAGMGMLVDHARAPVRIWCESCAEILPAPFLSTAGRLAVA